MLHWWEDELRALEHLQRLYRGSKMARCYRGVRTAASRPVCLRHRVLAWLGGGLVSWGRRLQSRYGAYGVPAREEMITAVGRGVRG